jgi:hypothetical protein
MQIDIPTTIKGTSAARRTVSYAHNMYPSNGVLLGRTGVQLTYTYVPKSAGVGDTDHIPRGLFVTRGGSKYYTIYGDRLFKADDAFAATSFVDDITMPVIPSGGLYDDKYNASAAISYTDIAIATGTTNYVLDPSTDTLTEVADADLPACRSVVYIDGRFVWLTADGESVFFSEVNAPENISALSFFDAESRPDKNVELLVLGNDLYVLGEKSIERFRNTGDSTAPFVRVANSVLSVGYIGGLVNLGDSAMFIGQYENSSIEIFQLSAGSLRQVSYGIVSEVLNSQFIVEYSSAIAPMRSARGQSWVDKGKGIVSFWLNGGFANICFSATKGDDGVYQWGILSDNPGNLDADYRDWGETEIIGDDAAVYLHNFSWVNAAFVAGFWLFQRDAVVAQAGIGRMATSHGTRAYDAGAGSTTEPVSKGVRVFIDKLDRKDYELSTLEVAYSIQGASTRQDIRLSLSETGNISSWSTPMAISIPSDDRGRVRFQKSGGLAQFHGHLSMIVESAELNGFALERLNANV